MALIQVFVDGSDRSVDVQRGGGAVRYRRETNAQGDASFVLGDVPTGFVPQRGHEVLIKEDAVDVFGGIIQTRPRQFAGADSAAGLTLYSIEAISWEYRLTQRRVWRQYKDELFEDIVADLNTDFLDGEGFSLSVLNGTVQSITFNGQTVAAALDELCSLETDGRQWYVTPAKVLTIDVQTATPAPATLDATNVELSNPKPSIEPEDTGYANTITAVGGNPDLPILFTAEDSTEISARAAIEGGSGIYHDTVEDNELTTAGQVQQKAEGVLLQRKQPREKFTAMTNVQGFELGQEVTVDLPNMGVSSKKFWIVAVETSIAPSATELWHTIEAVDQPFDGSWQSSYRRSIQPKRIPMQIEATPGLVRIDPKPGVLIHDPPPAPAEVFQGPPSGTLPSAGYGAIGITNEEQGAGGLVLAIARGGLANTGGCSGGTFPGCPGNCFANRQSVLYGFPIAEADEEVGTTATFCTSWDELEASSFKGSMVVSPDNSLVCFVERKSGGGSPVVGVVGLDGSGFRSSVSVSTLPDNNNSFEGAWVGDHIYIPTAAAGGQIVVIDASDPDNLAVETTFNTTGTGTISSVIPNRAGTALYAREEGGLGQFIALDITDPSSITEEDVQATADLDYLSLGLDEDGTFDDPQLIAFTRADASNVRYARLPLTDAHTFGTLDEGTVPLSTVSMEGWTCLYFVDTAVAWRVADPDTVGANNQVAHVFNVDPDNGVTFEKTLTYTHILNGNYPQARSYLGKRWASWFGFNTSAQITYMVQQFDQVVPYEIEDPLRTDFGGTGVDGKLIDPGDILYGVGSKLPFGLLKAGPEGSKLTSRPTQDPPVAWESGVGFTQAAIDHTDSPYQVPDNVDLVLADASLGAIEVDLPAVASSFERLLVVKNDGDGSFDVTLDPNGVETIDGALQVVLGQDAVRGIAASVNEWEVLFGVAGNGAGIPRGHIDGLVTELGSDADHDVLVNPGQATAALTGQDALVELEVALTKQIDAAWAQGDGVGGLASGTVAASTLYHLLLITNDTTGEVDWIFDTSSTGANAPSGWTARRRFASVFTDGSANIRGYDQVGDRFVYRSPVPDVADLTGTLGTYEVGVLTVPPEAVAIVSIAAAVGATQDAYMRLRSAGSTIDVVGNRHAGYADADASEVKRIGTGRTELPVDSGSSIEYTMIGAGAAPTWAEAQIFTQGWIDDRGRNQKPEAETVSDMWIPFGSNNQAPFGEIGNVADLVPDLFSNWTQHNTAAWDDGATEGASMEVPCAQWQGKTVDVYFGFGHVSATAGGASLKDIRVQLDVGPRANKEAQGAPNDAASTRVQTTIEVAPTAGANQHAPFYELVGSFDVGASDVFLIFELSRLGADVLDTFNASIGAAFAHLVPQS